MNDTRLESLKPNLLHDTLQFCLKLVLKILKSQILHFSKISSFFKVFYEVIA